MHIYKTTTGNSITQSLQQLSNTHFLLSLKKVSLLTYDLSGRSSSDLPVSAEIYKPDCNICPSGFPLSPSVLEGFSWESKSHIVIVKEVKKEVEEKRQLTVKDTETFFSWLCQFYSSIMLLTSVQFIVAIDFGSPSLECCEVKTRASVLVYEKEQDPWILLFW